MDLPHISICMPIWNRTDWLPLILTNLKKLDYPKEKLEWLILDDSREVHRLFPDQAKLDEVKEFLSPIEINYKVDDERKTIGEKRNWLCKNAKHKIIAFMDSDDMYFSNYLKHSIEVMRKNKASLVGSPEMLFLYPFKDWKITGIRCSQKRQIHEASMVFTKKHFRCQGGFIKSSQGEGCKMVDNHCEGKIATTDIQHCMMCIAHIENTVNKDMFLDAQDLTNEITIPSLDKQIIWRCVNKNEYLRP